MEIERLCPSVMGDEVGEFYSSLSQKVIGQEQAVMRMTEAYQAFLSGMAEKDRPISVILNLGPTGVGKTHVVRTAADILFGTPHSLLWIDCAEFQESHEVCKLIGSPPGYIGREIRPLLANESIYRFQKPQREFALVLFDEVEKAHPAVWDLLLGVLDNGWLGLGDNSVSDFTRAIIVFTSNVGAREMERHIGSPVGFRPSSASVSREEAGKMLDHEAVAAAGRMFPPEFMNRVDSVVVFRELAEEGLRRILELELNRLQDRVTRSNRGGFVFHLTDEAKTFLLRQGSNRKQGARPLKRALERYLGGPLQNLAASGQARAGDLVAVEHEIGSEELVFSRIKQAVLVKPPGTFVHS